MNFEAGPLAAETMDGLKHVSSTASSLAVSPQAIQLFSEGLRRLERAEISQAVLCFERALERSPQFADAHVALGVAHAVECRVYPALDHLHRAADIEPANFNAHFKLAQIYFKLRIPRKGYEEAQWALECATAREHRQRVAQLLRDERERSRNAVLRPTWSRPWTRVGIAMLACAGVFAV
ncbi:MAG: hypothetical protein ACRD18_07470, partial [Terriglobia bacterium]